jgi:LacI family transcriptional regulator, galactose operon repressor
MRRDVGNVTIQDIAERAGVSVSTVSRVLNKTVPVDRAKRQAVLGAVEALGYRPSVVAQELARGRSMAVGVLPQGISNPFYSRLLKGVEQGLRGTAFHPVFASGEQPVEEAEALSRLLASRVEALILMGGQTPDERLVRLAQRVPLIAIGRNLGKLEHRCMRVDNEEGGYKATRHLIDLGHTRIVHITGLSWHSDAIKRRYGYERALAEAGLPLDSALIVEGDWEEQSGLSAVEHLFARGIRFTAIFCGNDQIAFGAALALFRRGLAVGRDVSIVGFDDQPSAAFSCPPLTTVRQPAVEMGMAAARAIVEELRGRGFVQPVFRTELVLRSSTGPPPVAQRRVARTALRPRHRPPTR